MTWPARRHWDGGRAVVAGASGRRCPDRHGPSVHRHRDPEDLQVRGRPRPDDVVVKSRSASARSSRPEIRAAEPDRLRQGRRPLAATGCCYGAGSPRKWRFLLGPDLLAEIMHAAGTPGRGRVHPGGPAIGPTVGAAMSRSPRGGHGLLLQASTRAGIEVAQGRRPLSKAWRGTGQQEPEYRPRRRRVRERVSAAASPSMMPNSAESCNASSRMRVPKTRMDEAITVARGNRRGVTVGDPERQQPKLGPVVNGDPVRARSRS